MKAVFPSLTVFWFFPAVLLSAAGCHDHPQTGGNQARLASGPAPRLCAVTSEDDSSPAASEVALTALVPDERQLSGFHRAGEARLVGLGELASSAAVEQVYREHGFVEALKQRYALSGGAETYELTLIRCASPDHAYALYCRLRNSMSEPRKIVGVGEQGVVSERSFVCSWDVYVIGVERLAGGGQEDEGIRCSRLLRVGTAALDCVPPLARRARLVALLPTRNVIVGTEDYIFKGVTEAIHIGETASACYQVEPKTDSEVGFVTAFITERPSESSAFELFQTFFDRSHTRRFLAGLGERCFAGEVGGDRYVVARRGRYVFGIYGRSPPAESYGKAVVAEIDQKIHGPLPEPKRPRPVKPKTGLREGARQREM